MFRWKKIIALKNLQHALNSFFKIVVNVTKEIFPNEYYEVMPQIFRLHTWVGYDVDGRGDIFWNDSFAKRLEVKLAQLELYNESLDQLIKDSKSKSLKKELFKVKEILNHSI